MATKIPAAKEGEEQATLFSWARMKSYFYPELEMMFHIPNGGKRTKSGAARFKAEGVKPGVPDICLPVPRGGYHGLYIELKRRKDSSTSAYQWEWIEKLQGQGYAAEVCKGWEAAAELIEKYLKGEY